MPLDDKVIKHFLNITYFKNVLHIIDITNKHILSGSYNYIIEYNISKSVDAIKNQVDVLKV